MTYQSGRISVGVSFVVLVGLAGCGQTTASQDSGEAWTFGNTEDDGAMAADTDGAVSDTNPDDPSRDSGGPEDTDAPDDVDDRCADSTCSNDWLDLKVRGADEGRPVRSFSGTVTLGGRTVDFACPASEGGGESYQCNYESIGSELPGETVESSVRIPAGPPDRPALREVDIEVGSDRGHYSGRVELRPYDEEVDAADGCRSNCRGSIGTVEVESEGDDPRFQHAATTAQNCNDGGASEFVFETGPVRGMRCDISSEPRLEVVMTGDPNPSIDRMNTAYPFGPDVSDASGQLCRMGACEPVSGQLSFRFYAGGESMEGYWTARTDDGETFESAFTSEGGCVGTAACR